MGRLVPNDLPMRKKANAMSQIDLMKEVSHCGTVEVSLECAGETSAVDCQGPFSYFSLSRAWLTTYSSYTPD